MQQEKEKAADELAKGPKTTSYWKEEEVQSLKRRNSKLYAYIQRKGPIKKPSPSPSKRSKENVTSKDQQVNKSRAETYQTDQLMSCKSEQKT